VSFFKEQRIDDAHGELLAGPSNGNLTYMSPIARPLAITIDCHDPRSLHSFWQQLVGGSLMADSPDDYLMLENIPIIGLMGFQKVPETKQIKNRVHLDLEVPDIEDAVASSIQIGASRLGIVHEEPANFFQVMSDPEGNEFCFILLK
jgi:predicted enzyme related to lactoylglutathione lyase